MEPLDVFDTSAKWVTLLVPSSREKEIKHQAAQFVLEQYATEENNVVNANDAMLLLSVIHGKQLSPDDVVDVFYRVNQAVWTLSCGNNAAYSYEPVDQVAVVPVRAIKCLSMRADGLVEISFRTASRRHIKAADVDIAPVLVIDTAYDDVLAGIVTGAFVELSELLRDLANAQVARMRAQFDDARVCSEKVVARWSDRVRQVHKKVGFLSDAILLSFWRLTLLKIATSIALSSSKINKSDLIYLSANLSFERVRSFHQKRRLHQQRRRTKQILAT